MASQSFIKLTHGGERRHTVVNVCEDRTLFYTEWNVRNPGISEYRKRVPMQTSSDALKPLQRLTEHVDEKNSSRCHGLSLLELTLH